ncbi:hypothetical protein [Cellulomonas palmilytica]|uniref:hypothetical protein n=1 Tax=Cellulomonas palmilytica TaxID=2608402 RepID=UPI001F214DB5|nr:hypothetical protein [Cellulomonas palmilytica]UJP39838.1 hypothetical protein F1D97_16350 [Cellulomonas palmilytica]
MGGVAYGRKVDESPDEVRYAFGATPELGEGVLVVPVADLDAWCVQGSPERPLSAQWVLVKALRVRRTSGRWPERVAFRS